MTWRDGYAKFIEEIGGTGKASESDAFHEGWDRRGVAFAGEVEDTLQRLWREMCDGIHGATGGEAALMASAFVSGLHAVGLLNDAEAEAWRARLKRCPEPGHDRDSARAWCAYCGDLPPWCEEAGERTSTCPYCANDDCRQCLFPLPPGETCEHDVMERHEARDRKFGDIRDYPRAHVTQAEFDALDEYSMSVPTGIRIGKRWKRLVRIPSKTVVDGWDEEWQLGYYAERRDGQPGYLECFRIIEIVPT